MQWQMNSQISWYIILYDSDYFWFCMLKSLLNKRRKAILYASSTIKNCLSCIVRVWAWEKLWKDCASRWLNLKGSPIWCNAVLPCTSACRRNAAMEGPCSLDIRPQPGPPGAILESVSNHVLNLKRGKFQTIFHRRLFQNFWFMKRLMLFWDP